MVPDVDAALAAPTPRYDARGMTAPGTLLDAIAHPVCLLDDHERLVAANDAACALFGTAREALLGETLAQLLARRPVRHELRPAPGGGHLVSLRDDPSAPPGSERALGAFARNVGLALRAFEANLIGMLEWEVAGAVRDANEAFLATIGYSRDELAAGRIDWRALTPPEWLAVDDEAIEELRVTGVSRPYLKELLRRDGSRVPVIVGSAASAPDAAAGTAFVLDLTQHGGTDRRLAEQLRESRAMHEKFLAATQDVAWNWDLTTGEILWNAQMTTVFGHPRVPATSSYQFWSEHVHPDDRARVTQGLEAAIADPAMPLWSDEYRFRRADGGYAVVLDRGAVLREAGHPVRAVGVMIDVTERRHMHAQLALADRMASLGTLAAGVAHEINNPLALVQANLDFVLDQLGARAAAGDPALAGLRAAVEEARQGGDRVRAIVDDLRLFSRPDERDLGPVDVRAAVESAIAMAWNEIRHRARLVRRLDEEAHVTGNPAQLGQVFLNLLVNGAQAIPIGAADRHTLTVEVDRRGDRVIVTVTDTGAGIAPDALPHIFEPFFTTKMVGAGTGLGLSICHRIVSSLGGTLEVESAPGQGSTFRVDLPACPAPRPASAPPAPARAGRRGRLAVVDDEPLIGRALARLLGDDHEVTVFERARDAMAWLDDGQACDVLICDLMMPEVSGIELHDWLAAHHRELAERTIFLTGGAFSAPAVEFVRSHRCLDKPIDVEALRRAIATLLR
jgi:PAS domain S-box-containing protein